MKLPNLADFFRQDTHTVTLTTCPHEWVPVASPPDFWWQCRCGATRHMEECESDDFFEKLKRMHL